MSETKLTDREAKVTLLEWPTRTKRLWPSPSRTGFWLRAQPREGRAVGPRLKSPGASLFTTQPDGMWIFLWGLKYADVVSVEVCEKVQNLNDKRSRYVPASHSLVLEVPLQWLREEIGLQRGGRQPRWLACRMIGEKPTEDLDLPVRCLRVLFAIPNSIYPDWVSNNVPTGWEYYCRHSALRSYNSQKMQDFLRQLAPTSHTYSR